MSNPTSKYGEQPQASGAHSLAEILSQPRCWADCLQLLESQGTVREISRCFKSAREWIFVGCGSSYYIALAAAASWTLITGTRARALPASELLLFPELAFDGATAFVPVLISRSGQTSEVLRAARFLKEKQIAFVAISCAPGQTLETMAGVSLVLPEADEQSTVMTRSFTSMLLALQYLAAALAGNGGLLKGFQALPAAAEKVLQDLPIKVREFVHRNFFEDYVCLGQGPYFGLACESALKVMEMSRTYAQSFHTLEFRHGPKSIISRATIVSLLLSEANHDVEVEVLEEMKDLGARIVVVAKRMTDRAHVVADLAFELACDLPEPSCLTPFVFAAQLLGFYTALQKGLDPDRPPNLTRVVLLSEAAGHPEFADEK
ncbi:MAG: SIS domain-containing protein [Acidobacteria bacterium]|nr:SIS domain-containing protein [Acidobacteriota bacterium]MBV9481383.1 SIS domain-containing protein [Acidobacteriota bacterium]